jgi:thiosulfate/3-mercaptopyruvate sulfurtransferase
LWWLLHWLGHEHVGVLDGGLAAWKRAKFPLEECVPVIRAASAPLTIRAGFGVVDAEYVLAHLRAADTLLLDARSPERFRGENETLDPVGGHVPGAVNRFFQENLDDYGCLFKPAAALRADFVSILAGRTPTHVVQLCGSGVSACHNILAMEVAGLTGSRLYPGSWSEWCSNRLRPVETGSG